MGHPPLWLAPSVGAAFKRPRSQRLTIANGAARFRCWPIRANQRACGWISPTNLLSILRVPPNTADRWRGRLCRTHLGCIHALHQHAGSPRSSAVCRLFTLWRECLIGGSAEYGLIIQYEEYERVGRFRLSWVLLGCRQTCVAKNLPIGSRFLPPPCRM